MGAWGACSADGILRWERARPLSGTKTLQLCSSWMFPQEQRALYTGASRASKAACMSSAHTFAKPACPLQHPEWPDAGRSRHQHSDPRQDGAIGGPEHPRQVVRISCGIRYWCRCQTRASSSSGEKQTADGHRLSYPAPPSSRNIWALQRMALDPHVQVHGQVILESFENFSLMQV